MQLMELNNVHKSYRKGGLFGNKERFDVLKDVNMRLEAGSCVGLLGRSGSGKSTLGRIILDLEPPDAGEILYQGRPVRELSGQEYLDFRRNFQVVFQNSLGSVNPRFTAGQIIAEPLQNFESLSPGQLNSRIVELLEQVGLPGSAADKYPHQFSGGELQRVCIARAIALNPRLIVLDEAVSSLDMLIQAKIVDLLLDLQHKLGTAYLFISHDLRVLLKICDRLLVMHEGRLVEQADRLADLEGFSHESFWQLLEAILPPAPAAAA